MNSNYEFDVILRNGKQDKIGVNAVDFKAARTAVTSNKKVAKVIMGRHVISAPRPIVLN